MALRANVDLMTRETIATFSERSARDGFTETRHVYDPRYKTALLVLLRRAIIRSNERYCRDDKFTSLR